MEILFELKLKWGMTHWEIQEVDFRQRKLVFPEVGFNIDDITG